MFLRGDRSEYIAISDEDIIKRHFPKAKIVTIKNAGHWLHAENPKDFFDAVMQFIEMIVFRRFIFTKEKNIIFKLINYKMKNLFVLLFALSSLFAFSQAKHEDGPYKEYYENGILKKEGYYKNDNKFSTWKDYYDTGQLKKIYTFDNEGESTGVEENYSINGNLISETKPAKGGGLIYKRIYDNGNIQLAYSLIPSKNGKRFIKNGGYKEYYENGALKIESLYTDNELSLFLETVLYNR